MHRTPPERLIESTGGKIDYGYRGKPGGSFNVAHAFISGEDAMLAAASIWEEAAKAIERRSGVKDPRWRDYSAEDVPVNAEGIKTAKKLRALAKQARNLTSEGRDLMPVLRNI